MKTPTVYPITIQQQESDFTLRASISTVISHVLNIAGRDATTKGFGIGELNASNYTWVLSRFAIEIDRLPKVFDNIEIATWVNGFVRIVSTRNFTLTDANGEIFGGAVSQWCMLDIKERKVVDLSKLHEGYEQYIIKDLPSPITPPKKIGALEPTATHIHRAAYSDIDFNKHVNSLRYIDLMIDMLPIEYLEATRPLRFDIQYIHECYLGDSLRVNYEQRGEISMFEIVRNGESCAVRCMIEWR